MNYVQLIFSVNREPYNIFELAVASYLSLELHKYTWIWDQIQVYLHLKLV